MASRKQRKNHRKTDRLPRRLFKQRRGLQLPPGAQVVYEPAGKEKMSAVLEEFIDPYVDMADDDEAYRKILSLGVLAWNAALLPLEKRQAMLDDTIKAGFAQASPRVQAEARTLIESMIHRKDEHFAANKRAIISFQLTGSGDDLHLQVASTL